MSFHDLDFGLSGGQTYLKIDARAGVFKFRPDGSDTDVTVSELNLELDPESVDPGWLCFVPGSGAQFVSDLTNEQPANIGSIEFKKGVRLNVWGSDPLDELGGKPLGLREIAATAFATRKAIAEFYRRAGALAENHVGEVPLVSVTRFNPVKMKNGTAHAPVFEITGWTPRRDEFAEALSSREQKIATAVLDGGGDLEDALPY